MKTLGEVLSLSAEFLKKKGIERARREVEELLSFVLKMPRIELYMQFDRPIVEEELKQLREVVWRRGKGEPWQYIAGEVEFLGCQIEVNRSVLIPRQETEILVDKLIKELPSCPLQIWDLCTGSGCIGIGVKKKRLDCHLVLSDLSESALAVAAKNGAKNGVEVEYLEGDLLAPFHGRKADIIICNPPYIGAKEYTELGREVRDWEPKRALVAGPGGYEFYERLAHELPSYLNQGAKVYLEIGRGMGSQIKNIFQDPYWVRHELLQDWSSHDRYYKLEIE